VVLIGLKSEFSPETFQQWARN